MSESVRISLDAMGGDDAPGVVIRGAAAALRRHPFMTFLFFGDEKLIRPVLGSYPQLRSVSEVVHTDVAVSMDDKPSHALRHGRRSSSMWLALDAVGKKDADVAVSRGNTGALMAMSRFCLKTMPGIDRPAVAVLWPTCRGRSIVLDVGATVGADCRQLVEFAIMGEAMARAVLGMEKPTVSLLNIGTEELKGLEEVRAAHGVLKELDLPMQYVGFVEGNDIWKGDVDVVVTEGFCGNIALKTAEGSLNFISRVIRDFLKSQKYPGKLLSYIAGNTLRQALAPLGSIPQGGVLLGLNGVVMKSHGGADVKQFASALSLACDMVRNGFLSKMEHDLLQHKHSTDLPVLADSSLEIG